MISRQLAETAQQRQVAVELRRGRYAAAPMVPTHRSAMTSCSVTAVGLFDMPWSSDSNRKRAKKIILPVRRHFALDFGPEQSMHGGHGHRA